MIATALVRRAALTLVMVASLAWLAAIVLAPRALATPGGSASARRAAAVVHLAGRQVCHQRPHRSFRVSGVPMPVCARCTGLYAGAPLGLAAGVFWRRVRRIAQASPSRLLKKAGLKSEAGGRRFFQEPARRWLLLAAAPTLGSVGLEWATGLSSALSRAVTAVPLGAAAAVVVALALVPHRAPADRSATLP